MFVSGSKVKKKRGIGLKVISAEGLKVTNWRPKVRGQRSKWKVSALEIYQILLRYDNPPIRCFYFALSSNQIPQHWEFSQSDDWTLRLPSNQIF
jgi:hypothetical protein